MSYITLLRKSIASFLALFLLIGVPATEQTHDVTDSDSCKYNFTVLSDVHMEGNNKAQRDRYIKTLYDVKNNESGNDAVVFLGDNTMNGQDIENLFFWGITDKIHPSDNIYTVMGNHDTGNGVNKFDRLSNRFWSYYNGFTGKNIPSPYYYCEALEDCYFIFMSTESDAVNSPDISDAQISWVDACLDKAEKDGVPAFIFNHHPYMYYQSGGDALAEVIEKHSDVFYICGHTHTTHMTVLSLDEDSHYINLPKCTDINDSENSEDDTGLGIQVEIYDSEVLIRARRFYNCEWVYEYSFDI